MSPSRAWGASRGAQEPVVEADEEEEPDEMLQRLKTTIGDMKRRKSMRSEEDEARLRALAEKEHEKAEDDATVEDEPEQEEAIAGPSTAREATPEIELRHVFARAPTTPRLSGVRDLHKRAEADARARNTGTPALDGMQEMFSRPSMSRRDGEREDIIPSSDDEEARAAAAAEHDSDPEVEPEPAPPPVRAPARNARLKKSETMPLVTRTAVKTAPVQKTASMSRIAVRPGSGRSTPNDEHQDEIVQPAPTRARARTATGPKTAAPKASGSQQVARPAVRTTKTERAPRSRKATGSDDDVAPAPAKAPAKKPSTRTTKAAAPARSAAASTRSKKPSPSDSTPDPLEDSSDEDNDAAPVASRVRQRYATGASEQDDSDDKPRTRRTPARAAARKPAAAAPIRKTAGRKAAPEKENTPDRVKEEDEEEPSPPPPPPPARTTTRRTTVRKADAGGQSEPEQTQTKARPARTRAATRG